MWWSGQQWAEWLILHALTLSALVEAAAAAAAAAAKMYVCVTQFYHTKLEQKVN